MRILQVIPTLDTRAGGPVQAIKELSEELNHRGIEISLFATKTSGRDESFTIGKSIRCEVFRSYGPKYFAYSPSLQKAVQEKIKQFDLVHIHMLWNFPLWMASYHARANGIPYIIRPCGMLARYSLSHHALRKKLYRSLIEDKNLNMAKAIHFTTEEEKHRSGAFGQNETAVVIPLGLKTENNLPFPPRGIFRKANPELANRKIILFLGRISFKKGLELLIEAFSELLKEDRDVHLIIAGPDDEGCGKKIKRTIAQKGIKKHITLIDHVSGSDKLALLADADLFCLPSYQENFGLSVIEAMASGLPVVISDQVNTHEEIRAAEAGLVTPCRVPELKLTLQCLLADTLLRKQMSVNGKKLVREKYAWDHIVDKTIQLYEEMIERSSKNSFVNEPVRSK